MANIVIPVLVMRELSRRSTGAFLTWAVAWIAYQGCYIGLLIYTAAVGQPDWQVAVAIGSGLHLLAAGAAAVLVLSITRRLRAVTPLPLGGTAR